MYVQNRRPRYRLRHSRECGVWNYLLDCNIILTQGAVKKQSKKSEVRG